MKNKKENYEEVAPDPSSLIESLRSVGYTLPTAVADIIDNSIAAGAKNISVDFVWDGPNSYAFILDDGVGMSEEELSIAMRPGSRHPSEKRSPGDLGRFGLGLKTASFSQCRSLSVLSKAPGKMIGVRTWDLDYLKANSQWRLLVEPSREAQFCVGKLTPLKSGTVVVWSKLDRITGDDKTGDAIAHGRFNDAVDQVRQHLSLTFHRFLEARSISLKLNDRAVEPWNPFIIKGKAETYVMPEENIPYGDSNVVFQGFILPHRDNLSDDEYAKGGGPKGWASQQGFYIYRNQRLLLFGDWLRLGKPTPWTREEHFRLARIRLDIGNNTDDDWHLDVKKSTARPPALIRSRLTDLAEGVRDKARRVFAHRGQYGKHRAPENALERPWISNVRAGRRNYRINREHPSIQAVLSVFPHKSEELSALLRLLEETVPVEQIWLDVAENPQTNLAPYEDIENLTVRADLKRTFQFLLANGINRDTAVARVRSLSPFNRFPELINEL